MVTATDSLTGTSYKEIKLYNGVNPQDYILISSGGVIDGPSTGYYFYVDNDVSTSTLTFAGNGADIDTLTFDCPVIFSTRQRGSSTGGNGKTITILGNVVFNKGVRFETFGRSSTASDALSKFYLGYNDPETTTLTMTCRYLDASSEQNMPFDANGYGKVHFRDGSQINVYAQKLATAAIDQLITTSHYNVIQSNINNHRVDLYFDEDMIGRVPASMRQIVVYPDSAPIRYNLHITANVDTELEDLPSNTQIYVTASDAKVVAYFSDTALIDVASGAKISFYDSTFNGAPLINLSGDGTLAFEVPDPENDGSTVSSNVLNLQNDSVVVTVLSGTPTVIPARGSNVRMPASYTFDEPHSHFEGFTFDLTRGAEQYNFGHFTLSPLYLYAYDEADSNTFVTVEADKGVNLYVDSPNHASFRNCVIYSSSDNDNYAFYKNGTGTFSFNEGDGLNKLFVGHNGFFIKDNGLNGSDQYSDIGEEYCKFYILADQMPEQTDYTFSRDYYNLNGLYWLRGGVYFGTDEGIYHITSQYLVVKNASTLSDGAGSLGLTLKNDTSGGDYPCFAVHLSGQVGSDSVAGRMYFDTTSSCNVQISDLEFYDNNTVPSPLLVSSEALVTVVNNIVFNMHATATTYVCNSYFSNIVDSNEATINLMAIRADKTYDLDISVNDTTTEPPFVYNNDAWYSIPVVCSSSETYKLINVNSGDGASTSLTMSIANSPTIDLHSQHPVIFTNVEGATLIFDEESEITNFGFSLNAPIVLHTGSGDMSIDMNDATVRVYGFGAIYKTGTGEITTTTIESRGNTEEYGFTVGDEHSTDMSDNLYTSEINPSDYQAEWFSDMASFTDENIVAGDKPEELRLRASYWDDLGGDIFDDWGFFYLYDISLGQYYFPLLDPINRPNGEFNTQSFEVFGRTFTITHGWCVQGIFKIDITSSTQDPFRFGAYGNMGSDGNTIYEHLDFSGTVTNLYYHHNWQDGDDNEQFYSYFIPKVSSEGTSRTYRVGYDGNLQPGEVGNDDDADNMNIVSNAVTHGLLVYFSKGNDVREWINADLIGGTNVNLHYYNQDYDYGVTGIVPLLEYTNEILIHEGTFNFVNADSRLTFTTDTSGNVIIGENGEGTTFTKGVTLNHSQDGNVTFNYVNYAMNDSEGYLLLNGTGTVFSTNTQIICDPEVSADVIRIDGTHFVINSGTYTNNGSGTYINIGQQGALTATGVTLTNNYGMLIYSDSNISGSGIVLTNVTLANGTDTPTIRHNGNNNMTLFGCTFDQDVTRSGPIIEHGESDDTVSGNIDFSGGEIDVSGTYTYFIRSYTSGYINTKDLVMDATNTNILWPTLRSSYERYLNEVENDYSDPVEPYTCSPIDLSLNYGYIAYSYDPTMTVTFYHNNNGIYYDFSAGNISTYDFYAAFGHLPQDPATLPVGVPAGLGTITYTGTMACTEFVDMSNTTRVTDPDTGYDLDQVFTEEVFAAGYVGKISTSNTETFGLTQQGSRVITMDLEFANSANVYLGDTSITVSYSNPIKAGVGEVGQLQGFSYFIDELSSPPSISIDAGNVTVSDTLETEFSIPIELYQTDGESTTDWGYALPIYIVPVSNDIIQFFQFKNSDSEYVSYATYSAYPTTVNRSKLQRMGCGATNGTFDVKYVGTGVYYEPEEGSIPTTASFNINLYGDGDNTTLLYSTDVNNTSITIVNATSELTHPMAYVGDFDLNVTGQQSVTLYDSETNEGNSNAKQATLNADDFAIVYTFTLKFRMPLITYDDGAHELQISGVDVHDTGNVAYTYSDPSGCSIWDASGNNVILTFDGDDTDEKTVEVTVVVSNIDSTHGGTVYFKRPNYPIQLRLTSLKTFKGFNTGNQIIAVEPTTQTASSYFNFPNLIIVTAEGVSYDSNDTPPTINVEKGLTKTISIRTAGVITADTPDVSEDGLQILVYITPSKDEDIMPTTTNPGSNIITVNENSYTGSIDITFVDNNKISGQGSYYTVTFDQSLYDTVESITYIDAGTIGGFNRYHTISHTLGIQPGTRVLITSNHSSDDTSQIPEDFAVASVDTSNNVTDIIVPTSYLIALPVSAYTNFIPYNTTTGDDASFNIHYKLVGIVSDEDPTSATLTEGDHYEIFDTDLETAAPNQYITINASNYDNNEDDPTTVLYFYIKTQAYRYIDFYAYYTGTASTDMANMPAVNADSAVKVGRYDFNIAPPEVLEALRLNVGTWLFTVGLNGELVLEYQGTEGTESDIGARYIFPKIGGVQYINAD